MTNQEFYFGSATQCAVKQASQQARFTAVSNALNVVVNGATHGAMFDAMNLIYKQWKKIERIVWSIEQELKHQTDLHNDVNRQLAALAETDDLNAIQQLMEQNKAISDHCYVLAERYLAGDAAFWAFKDRVYAAGQNPDTLKEVIVNINDDPNWGIPELLRDKEVVVKALCSTTESYSHDDEQALYDPAAVCPPEEQAAAEEAAREEQEKKAVKEKKVQRSFFDRVINAAGTVVRSVKNAVTKVVSVVSDVVTTTVTKAKNFFGLVGSTFANIFSL